MSEQLQKEVKEGGAPRPKANEADGEPADRALGHKPGKHFEIDIFRAWCKSCGICGAFCPRGCIGFEEDGTPVVKDSERCTGCGWCELHCPDFAISVRPHKELKVPREES
jgi:2-oxoglutarate ferredoxin oxidoreductase subunit delta